MTDLFELPPILDLIAAPGLHESFTGKRGAALAVDAGAVQRLGAQCLQVMLAARAAWAADGMPLLVENLSGEFAAALELMGVAPDDLAYCAQQDGKELAA